MSPFNRKIELSPRLKLSVGRGLSQNHKLKIAAICLLAVAVGLTVNAARLMFFSGNKTTQNGQDQGQVLGAEDNRSTSGSEVQFQEYTVQKTDTLFSISQKYNINWTTLATLNNLKSPFIVKPGQTIKIPK